MKTTAGTIVAAVDGSVSSEQAVEWAVDQAVAEHRPLTLAHAVNSMYAAVPNYNDAALVYPEEARSLLMAEGQKLLSAARLKVRSKAPDLEIHEVAEFLDPRGLLLELSEDAAMVVLGSRGRGPIRSLLLGSVGVAVVRHARCPVVVHRAGADDAANGIVVGVALSEESRPVLEFAFRQASLRELPLTVLHCYWEVQSGTAAGVIYQSPAEIEAERAALEQVIAGMSTKHPEVSVSTEMRPGAPHQVLAEMGERMDLIVVGARQSGRLARMALGSVSAALVERATNPVAVVPVSSPR